MQQCKSDSDSIFTFLWGSSDLLMRGICYRRCKAVAFGGFKEKKKTIRSHTHNWERFGYAFTAAYSSLWQFAPAKTRRKPTVLPLIIALSRRQQGFELPTGCQSRLLKQSEFICRARAGCCRGPFMWFMLCSFLASWWSTVDQHWARWWSDQLPRAQSRT